MEQYAIYGNNLQKKFKGFTLDIGELKIPKGFATALIGENGAGKSTLLNMLSGIRLDYQGQLTYFGKYSDEDREKDPYVKEHIGYVGGGNYYLPQWTIKDIEDVSGLLFEGFHPKRFRQLCSELAIFSGGQFEGKKKAADLSDGTRMKLMLAGVLARDTKLLILDEPASPLDPLMRDKLCEMLREYLNSDEGEKTVFFSTHNVADMENVTDYAIIMEHGSIVEQGFVEDLKEKYVLVRGEVKDAETAKKYLYSLSGSNYGFEGICPAEQLDKLAGMDIQAERPNLSQICVAIMKANSQLR
jgi:ABC-2 type transport system ATP-binding protein